MARSEPRRSRMKSQCLALGAWWEVVDIGGLAVSIHALPPDVNRWEGGSRGGDLLEVAELGAQLLADEIADRPRRRLVVVAAAAGGARLLLLLLGALRRGGLLDADVLHGE